MAHARKRAPTVIGLVGGIGAGKTTVANLLGALGAEVVSADPIVHDLLRKEHIRKKIARALENPLPEQGEALRRYVAERIFRDARARRSVEAVLHPLVEERARRIISATKAPVVVLDVPLLLETGMDRYCQLLVFVAAPPDLRRCRVVQERGWSEEEFRLRENAQGDLSGKQKACHVVIDNGKGLKRTEHQVGELWRRAVKATR